MPTYRQAPGRDTWHWCRRCSKYPSNPAKTKTLTGKERPRGNLCYECRGKERRGHCF